MAIDVAPCDLKCNYLTNPLAIRDGAPAFSWSSPLASAAIRQHAYQVLVANDEGQLSLDSGNVWDSGVREGDTCFDVLYEGDTLEPLQPYYWKVCTWSRTGARSGWSDTATFEMGIGGTGAWTASWISWDDHVIDFDPATEMGPVDAVALGMAPAPYFRHEFDVRDGLDRARLYITARGLYEARLNGFRVGDAVLTPGWTDYSVRLQYQAYDVTSMLCSGSNAMGAMLGDGWYCGYFGFRPKRSGAHYGEHPELLAQLYLRYLDGTSEWIATDKSWKTNWGEIMHADPLMGECHFSGLDPTGWDTAGFDDERWFPVLARGRDTTSIVADPGPPIRITDVIAPRSLRPIESGKTIVDFGQNLTGWLRIKVDAEGGRTVRIRHGEALDANGHLYVENLRTARQIDEFVTSGGPQVLEPHFTWHGFRYAEVTGYPGTLSAEDISALVVHSDVEVAGTFECSDPIVNQLHTNIDWSLRGNFISVPTDCPQRDERLVWLGDAQIFVRTAAYRRDVLAFFDKWLDDVTDAQLESGAFTDIAPNLGLQWCGAPAWGDAGVVVPWTLYKMYGALQPAARCYDAMSKWMEFIAGGNSGHLRTRHLGNNYGDWLAPGRDETPHELLATAYWAYDASLMSELATALGRHEDAAHYQDLADAIAKEFVESFVDETGRVTSNTQTAYTVALFMNLLPAHLHLHAVGHLVEAVRDRGWHLSTGFVGVGYILPVLSANGYTDVAYRLLDQETFPSWRYPIRQGATTIWERWDGWTAERGFQSPHMNSFNHYALGSVGEWFYRFVAGIDQHAESAGFQRVLLRPHPGGSLKWAAATHQSRHGPIRSSWRCDGDTLSLSVNIPENVTATVHLPSSDPVHVQDQSGRGPLMIEEFCGNHSVNEAVYEVGPGEHRFVGPYDIPVQVRSGEERR
jgi:alpha-L-rhamnosidase